jgi:AP2-associated kinase
MTHLCATGGNLVNIIKSRWERPFLEQELLKIFQIVCEAVAVLHSSNPPIFHRDLKVGGVSDVLSLSLTLPCVCV